MTMHQVTFRNYSDCVVTQLAFLTGKSEADLRLEIAQKMHELKELYDHNVSVDAAAQHFAP